MNRGEIERLKGHFPSLKHIGRVLHGMEIPESRVIGYDNKILSSETTFSNVDQQELPHSIL